MTEQWHLKKYDDGSVFGPVEEAILQEWASKGEISPYDMLSRDGVKWMAAPELDSLQMNWIVEFPDGEMYGPTCVPAIRAFLHDGQLTPDNSIRNATTGDKCLISEHGAFQDLLGGDGGAEPAGEPAEQTTETGEVAAADDETEQLRQRVPELEGALQQAEDELATSRAQEETLRAELTALQHSVTSAHSEKEASHSQTRTELDQLREQFNLLADMNKTVRENYEQAVADLNQKIESAMQTIENDLTHEVDLSRQVAEAAQREAQYREQIVNLERELVKTQQAHAELLAKFGALNERLTRFLEAKS